MCLSIGSVKAGQLGRRRLGTSSPFACGLRSRPGRGLRGAWLPEPFGKARKATTSRFTLEDLKFRRARDLLRSYPILRVRGLRTFEHAAQIYRACRRKGFTVRNTVDCLIAATCLEAGTDLYQNDRDFEAIAKVRGLRLYRPFHR